MKRIIPILLLGVSLSVASCSENLLEIKQKSVLGYDFYFEEISDDEVLNLLADVYSQIRVVYQPAFTLCPNNMTGDMYVGGSDASDGAENHQMSSFLSSSTNSQYEQMWTRFYSLLYKANTIVDNLDGSTEVQKRAIAEAKVARAWSMMHTVMLWGNPPLVTSILDADNMELPNTDASESWAWIEQNLTEAAEVLPSKRSLGNQASIGGRFSKEAALGYLAKAQVYQGKYEEAQKILKNLIDSGMFALVSDYSTLFRKEADFCDEYLFEIDLDHSSLTDMRALVTTNFWQNNGWRSDQLQIPTEVFNNGWGYMNPSLAFGEALIQHDGYDGARRRAIMLTYDEVISNFTYADGTTPGVKNGKKLHDNAGYMRYKYCLINADIADYALARRNAGALCNIPLLRYADILLLYAECCAKTGIDTQQGLAALNEVRSRAGLDIASSLSMDDETYGVKAERRFELWLEDGNRFYDLVRWGDYGKVISDIAERYSFGRVHYWLNGFKDGSAVDATRHNNQAWSLTKEPINGYGFYVPGKHERLPYPYTEINNNRNLVQNEGW